MTPCQRPPAPPLLAAHGEAAGKEYARRRGDDPSYRFQWPQRDGCSLGTVARDELCKMTQGHCSYCDGFPLGNMDQPAVDHLRPKGDPRFYELVCQWDNLYVACTACNGHKREQWDERLLAPDASSYQFERFFSYDSLTGELRPNVGAAPADQERAQRTIEIFGLNRAQTCRARLREAKAKVVAEHVDERPYRFLAPLVGG